MLTVSVHAQNVGMLPDSPTNLDSHTVEYVGLSGKHFSVIKTSPWGILVGEKDSRAWNNPYNGLYLSSDLGNSWIQLGLEGRGITDVAFNEQGIYAATYYNVDGAAGLFFSNNLGKTWTQLHTNVSATSVFVQEENIYLGTEAHGLWVSVDGGKSWNQHFGTGHYGDRVFSIFGDKIKSNPLIFVNTETGLYSTQNNGLSWNKVNFGAGIAIKDIVFYNDRIYMGTFEGLYFSEDKGSNWYKSTYFQNNPIAKVSPTRGKLYVTYWDNAIKKNSIASSFSPYASSENVWTQIETEGSASSKAQNATWLFSDPEFIYLAHNINGIYKIPLLTKKLQETHFRIPWDYKSETELIEYITAFFDHKYPLNGYVNYSEKYPYSQNTTNFMGETGSEPHMYYSSHGGVDFGLVYGTPILAVAEGHALYGYQDQGLGHYIKISHDTGHQTIYAHLQDSDLVTTSASQPVYVTKGQTIGRIGLSGRTTGPHLHFEVRKDVNNSGTFDDDFPYGRTDPFGWSAISFADPWENYTWSDTLGTHTGTDSQYLWGNTDLQSSTYVNSKGGVVKQDNKQVIIEQNSSHNSFTVFIEPYPKPAFPIQDNKLTYLTGSSLLVNAYGNLGEDLPPFLKPVKIEVDLNNSNLDEIDENTIYMYYWNPQTKLWEPVESVFDLASKRVTGNTTHFSHFAVFAQKKTQAQATLEVEALFIGEKQDNWYINYPIMNLKLSNRGLPVEDHKIFYSIDGKNSWNQYQNETILETNGIIQIDIKVFDKNGTETNFNKGIIKIDTENKRNKTVRVNESIFSL